MMKPEITERTRIRSINLERQRNSQLKLKYKFATQKVGSGIVAVAIEEDALNYSGILRMNSTGAFILQQLQSDISCAELTERMLLKYDADKVTVEKILVDFLGMLSGEKLLLDDKNELVKESDLKKAGYIFLI